MVSESVETVLGTATYSHSKVGAFDFLFMRILTINLQVGLWQATIVENVRSPSLVDSALYSDTRAGVEKTGSFQSSFQVHR